MKLYKSFLTENDYPKSFYMLSKDMQQAFKTFKSSEPRVHFYGQLKQGGLLKIYKEKEKNLKEKAFKKIKSLDKNSSVYKKNVDMIKKQLASDIKNNSISYKKKLIEVKIKFKYYADKMMKSNDKIFRWLQEPAQSSQLKVIRAKQHSEFMDYFKKNYGKEPMEHIKVPKSIQKIPQQIKGVSLSKLPTKYKIGGAVAASTLAGIYLLRRREQLKKLEEKIKEK